MQLIDGKQTAATIKAEIKAEVEDIVARGGKRPHQTGRELQHAAAEGV